MQFNEHHLELSIMELFENQGYAHITGSEIHHEKTEVLLIDVLRNFLVFRYGSQNITENEITSAINRIKNISSDLYDENKKVLDLLCNGFTLRRDDPNQKDLFIQLIDFDEPENNMFNIVNQLEVQGREQLRIPDGIVYINGIPVVVLEFKSAIKENTTIEDAYKQLTIRYRRDIPELFKYNAFVVISDGANTKVGSLFSPYEFFYAWRKVESTDKEVDGISSLITMVNGLFRMDRLVAVIKDFIYFPDSTDKEVKIVCRYPQYFAATKLFDSIKSAMKPNGNGKGGIYFGATGCGKSYTMVFLSRMIMKSKEFNSPTIVVITDRTDLDDQLSKIFLESKNYIGDENIKCIEARDDESENKTGLKQELKNRASGGVYLTTIQKFSEDIKLLSDRSNIICISDEAHRSQNNLDEKLVINKEKGIVEHKFGFAHFLHESFPNATYVGFTGTPIDEMEQVFGDVVDTYTMKESVAKQLNKLLEDMLADRKSFEEMGIDFEEKAFYVILVACAKKFEFEEQYPEEKMIDLAKKIKLLVAKNVKYTDWNQRIDVKAEMKADLRILLDDNGYPPVPRDEVFKEVFEQTENFKKYEE